MKPEKILILFCAACILALSLPADAQPAMETGALQAFDIPSDAGTAIGLSWPVSLDAGPGREYVLYRSLGQDGPFEEIDRFPEIRQVVVKGEKVQRINRVKKDVPKYFGFAESLVGEHFVEIEVEKKDGKQIQHYYRFALFENGQQQSISDVVTAVAIPNWFAWNRLNNFILMLVFCGFVLFFIEWAKRNPNLFIRRLAGL